MRRLCGKRGDGRQRAGLTKAGCTRGSYSTALDAVKGKGYYRPDERPTASKSDSRSDGWTRYSFWPLGVWKIGNGWRNFVATYSRRAWMFVVIEQRCRRGMNSNVDSSKPNDAGREVRVRKTGSESQTL